MAAIEPPVFGIFFTGSLSTFPATSTALKRVDATHWASAPRRGPAPARAPPSPCPALPPTHPPHACRWWTCAAPWHQTTMLCGRWVFSSPSQGCCHLERRWACTLASVRRGEKGVGRAAHSCRRACLRAGGRAGRKGAARALLSPHPSHLRARAGGADWAYRGCISERHPSEVLPLSWPEPPDAAPATAPPGYAQVCGRAGGCVCGVGGWVLGRVGGSAFHAPMRSPSRLPATRPPPPSPRWAWRWSHWLS